MTDQQLAEKEYPEMGFEITDQNIKHLRRGFIKGRESKQGRLEESLQSLVDRLDYIGATDGFRVNSNETLRDLKIAKELLNKKT